MNTWLVGGSAEFFGEPETIEELRDLVSWAEGQKRTVTVLGSGSNVLVADSGLSGLVISMKKLNKVTSEVTAGNFVIRAQAGALKMELLKLYLKNELPPALFLAGIPGTVGGGIVMNAGVGESFVPREFCEIVTNITVLRPHGPLERIDARDLKWSYRHCEGWRPGILVEATLSTPFIPEPGVREKVRQANQLRLQRQPLDMPSCGSVFRNPPTHKAARLIEECGLKGFAIGDAQVSLKHANFIVNRGNARAEEIWQVIEHVRKMVAEKKQIHLETEVVRLP